MGGSVKAIYKVWITAYVASHGGNVRNRCGDAVEHMSAAFPELRTVPGYAIDGNGVQHEHWWCTDTDESVVDPTASQFKAPITYKPWQPGDVVRVGRCMNCGDHIYASVQRLDGNLRSVCDDDCAAAFAATLVDDHA